MTEQRARIVRAATFASAILLSATPILAADDVPFTGSFTGSGRFCQGGLHIRAKTLEWISTYSRCKPSPYVVLEKDLSGEHPRIVFRITHRSRQCDLEVFELESTNRHADKWEAVAYPSLEAYQKRDQPEWAGSQLPERAVLPCMMFGSDR